MSWIAGTIGAAAQLGSDLFGAATRQAPTSSTHQAKLGLKYGKLYDEWSARNMPKYNRAGMEAAGYNPILAYSDGQAAHGMPSIAGASAYDSFQSPDLQSAVSAYFQQQEREQGLDMQRQQIANAKAQGANISALTGLYLAQKAKVVRDTFFPTNANGWYQVNKLLRYMKKENVFKSIGEALSGRPNNIVINNSQHSASSNFRDALKSVDSKSFTPTFPTNPVPTDFGYGF